MDSPGNIHPRRWQRILYGLMLGCTLGGMPVLTEAVDDLFAKGRITLTPSQQDTRFGKSVALSADGMTVLAGAPGRNCPNGERCGTVAIFRRTGDDWRLEATLQARDARRSALYGDAVALSADGTVALIGAVGHGQGAAYFYRRNGTTWQFEAEVLALETPPIRPDAFGGAVALDSTGTLALIGGFGTSCVNGGSFCGAAYVFRLNGTRWIQEAVLRPPATARSGFFGLSVAIEGTTAVVGAPFLPCSKGENCGAVYRFGRGSTGQWTLTSTLTSPKPERRAEFGTAVNIPAGVLGTTGFDILIGTPGSCFDVLNENCGVVQEFVLQGRLPLWRIQTTFLPDPDATQEGIDAFGTAIATDRAQLSFGPTGVILTRHMLIGAPFASKTGCLDGPLCGATSLFVSRTGQDVELQYRLTSRDLSHGDQFGTAVALAADGMTAVVGAPERWCEDFLVGPACGAIYIFSVPR
jgi:hypothetical protein